MRAETVGFGRERDFAGLRAGLHDRLRQTVEGAALRAEVRFMTSGVAISDAEQLAVLNVEANEVGGVGQLYTHDRQAVQMFQHHRRTYQALGNLA